MTARPIWLPLPFPERERWLIERGFAPADVARLDPGRSAGLTVELRPEDEVVARRRRSVGGDELLVVAPANDAPNLHDRFELRGRGPIEARRPLVMGIVNVTPDSFSDGGLHLAPEVAIEAALAMLDDGADLVDVGGESTRPGATEVPIETELARVVQVIEAIHSRRPDALISIDTRKGAVAREAVAAGAAIVNDVSGLAHDPELAAAVAASGSALVVGHVRGTPATMQADPRFDDVVGEVAAELASSVAVALGAGVPRARILVDPGIGFGKLLAHNLELLRALPALRGIAAGVVVGASRKRFVGELTGRTEPRERLAGSLGAVAAATERAAAIVRVHDVRETVDYLRVYCAVSGDGSRSPR